MKIKVTFEIKYGQYFLISFGTVTPEIFTGLFLQVSKISFAGLFILVLLFQQLDVGSEASGKAMPADFRFCEDTYTLPDSGNILSPDTLLTDTIHLDSLKTDDNSLKSSIKYTARDSMPSDLENQIVYLYGDATVDYEDLHLKAEYIMIDMGNKELFAEGIKDSTGTLKGSPEFSQGDQNFRSTSMRYNFDTKKGKIANVITKEGEGYIHGEIVKKDPENNFFIKNGQFTTCELDTPHFSIQSNKLKVISNNKIVTGPAYLTIEGVPTPLLIPFGFFPNKKGRSSGLIFPAVGESASRGFNLEHLGYYFGFNDYVTLALTSDIYTKGSYSFRASTLYKKRYHYSGNFDVSYANTVTSEKELPDYATNKDFHINWIHSQDSKLNPNSSFSANVRAGSSNYYKNTISSVDNFLSNTFQSSISYYHSFPGKPVNLSLNVSHWQNTITKEIRITAPELSFNVSRINPFKRKILVGKQRWYEKIGTSYSLRATNNIETKDSLLFRNETLDEMKNGIQHSIPISTSFNLLKYFNVSPSASYTERWYFRTIEKTWNPDSQKVITSNVNKFKAGRDYQASLGITTHLYGMYQFRRGSIKAVRHVLTPSASINYRPDFGEEKYGYYKKVQSNVNGDRTTYSVFENTVYSGPSSGPFAKINFSLDNNIEMKVNSGSDTGATEKKIKLLENLRIAGSYNVIADSMRLSNFNIGGRTTLLDKVSLNFDGTLDPYSFDENNRDYDKFMINEGGRLVRLTSASLSMNFSLNKTPEIQNKKYSKEEIDYINQHPEEYVDFNVPYNLAVSYSYNYLKTGNAGSKTTQSASFTGDLSLTPQWKIGFNSWYDITDGRFTNFGVNIYRDLHCWEMRMNWIPFGFQESWNFQINVKSTILQDLKLLKRKEFYDR